MHAIFTWDFYQRKIDPAADEAAPCSTIIVGLLSRRPFKQIALIAVIAGILAGLATWIWVNDDSVDWLYATLASFVTPIIVLLIFPPLTRKSTT